MQILIDSLDQNTHEDSLVKWSLGVLEKSGFNFLSSYVWNGFFWSCFEWHLEPESPFLLIHVARYPGWTTNYLLMLFYYVKVWKYEQCLQKALRFCCFMKSSGKFNMSWKWLSLVWWSQALLLSSVLYCPITCLEIVLIRLIFFYCLGSITVKTVMACKLVYHEILFKGSISTLFYFSSSWTMKKREEFSMASLSYPASLFETWNLQSCHFPRG